MKEFKVIFDEIEDINREELREALSVIEESGKIKKLRDIVMDSDEEQYEYFTRS